MNARFKIRMNGGTCTIALKPGDQLHHVQFRATDEGFRREVNIWRYDVGDGYVTKMVHIREKDCDGIGEVSATFCCPLLDLRAHAFEDLDGTLRIGWPKWEQSEEPTYYDQFAQRMGY